MARKAACPDYVKKAIVCGCAPGDMRSWRTKPIKKLTDGEKVLRFAADHLFFPEGKMVGKPLILDDFQAAFILSVFDSPQHVSKAILSMARRGGKTLLLAVILLAFVVGPLKRQNTLIRSAAMSREQAGLMHRMMTLILAQSPDLGGLWRSVPSTKRIIGLRQNVEYQALSRDAKTGHGQGIYVLVIDEAGQIDAPNDDFLDMLRTSLGTYSDSREFIISTQAPSDAAFLSVEIDSAIRDQPANVVCHLYAASTDTIADERNWYDANPSLRAGYRSMEDLRRQADEAERIPSKQGGFLNLCLNRRVALEQLWLAPSIWKANSAFPDERIFSDGRPVALGCDLSLKTDLTAIVAAAMDDEGVVHLLPFVFSPEASMEVRQMRDRAPYAQWVRDGYMQAVPGQVVDYEWVFAWMKQRLDDMGCVPHSVHFDRWRMEQAKADAERVGFAVQEWVEVGQGFQSMSPRMEHFETLLLQSKIRHGGHPLLNLAASHCIAQADPAGNRKPAKNKSTQRIDPIVAAIMAAGAFMAPAEQFSVSQFIA